MLSPAGRISAEPELGNRLGCALALIRAQPQEGLRQAVPHGQAELLGDRRDHPQAPVIGEQLPQGLQALGGGESVLRVRASSAAAAQASPEMPRVTCSGSAARTAATRSPAASGAIGGILSEAIPGSCAICA